MSLPPRALSHPLPAGMRDLLPAEAETRRSLSSRIVRELSLFGYSLVTLPAFELADVLERGLGTLDPSDVLRFIEPESGEVAALRPDMTPQIARMVATRLASEPPPLRLAYEGTVLRRRQGRARRHRQIPQCGVELYGSPSIQGDLEILRVAAAALRAVGLEHAVIDLGHARIARGLLERLPEALGVEVGDALAQKDVARVHDLVASADASLVPRSLGRVLEELADLHGGETPESAESILERAARLLAGTAAAAPLRELRALWNAAIADANLAGLLRLDLGAVRGFAYYTGPIFDILADGPGEPIGGGGRYDELLARFDTPMPAVGFALHLDSVAWARRHANLRDEPNARVVVAPDGEEAQTIVAALRARGVAAVVHDEASAPAFARAWAFTHVVALRDGAAFLARTGDAGDQVEELGAIDLQKLSERFASPTSRDAR